MEDELKSSLAVAESVKGKKLLWVDADPESAQVYFLFEGDDGKPGKILAAMEVAEIGETGPFLSKLLEEELPAADRMKALQALLAPSAPKVSAPVPTAGVPAASAAVLEVVVK